MVFGECTKYMKNAMMVLMLTLFVLLVLLLTYTHSFTNSLTLVHAHTHKHVHTFPFATCMHIVQRQKCKYYYVQQFHPSEKTTNSGIKIKL